LTHSTLSQKEVSVKSQFRGTRFKVAWASAATVFSRVRVYSESDARAYRDKDGVSERALFVIDAKGKVYWSFVSPIGVNPGADGILSALEDLRNKQTVPAMMKAK
jgi:peroxiredoxin